MKIINVPEEDLKKFWEFQINYLGDKSFEYLQGKYSKNKDFFIECFEREELIGIAYGVLFKPDEIELRGIATKDEFKRKGIAKQMLGFFENIVKEKGFKKVSLGAAKGPNENVIGFYLKYGYKEIEDKGDFVVMEKLLD